MFISSFDCLFIFAHSIEAVSVNERILLDIFSSMFTGLLEKVANRSQNLDIFFLLEDTSLPL